MTDNEKLVVEATEKLTELDPGTWVTMYAARLMAALKVSESQRTKGAGLLIRSTKINDAALDFERELRASVKAFMLVSGWQPRRKKHLKPTVHRWEAAKAFAVSTMEAMLKFGDRSAAQAIIRPTGNTIQPQAVEFLKKLAEKPLDEQTKLLAEYLRAGNATNESASN